jgi:hypothetical protein
MFSYLKHSGLFAGNYVANAASVVTPQGPPDGDGAKLVVPPEKGNDRRGEIIL